MSPMVGSGFFNAPEGIQAFNNSGDGFQGPCLVPFGSAPGSGMLESASGAAPLAFINDNSLYTQSRGNHSTNNEGIQQTIKRAPFFVAQEEAKFGWGLGLNNTLHTNTMLKK